MSGKVRTEIATPPLGADGSVLREDFRPDSDVDVLVEFEPGHVPGFGIIDMENELARLVGHKVDMRTPRDLSLYFRDRVVREAKIEYDKTGPRKFPSSR